MDITCLLVLMFACSVHINFAFVFFESVDTTLIVDVAVFLFLPISKHNGFVVIVSSGLIGASD